MLGVLYAFFGLIFVPFFAIAALAGAFAQHAAQSQGGSAAAPVLTVSIMLVMSVLFPIFYGVMGFIFGVITAAIYNPVAQWIGGLEVEVE